AVADYADLVALLDLKCRTLDEQSRRSAVVPQHHPSAAAGDDALAVLELDLDEVALAAAHAAQVDDRSVGKLDVVRRHLEPDLVPADLLDALVGPRGERAQASCEQRDVDFAGQP